MLRHRRLAAGLTQAQRLLAAATAQREARGTPLPPAERPAYDRAVQTVRTLLCEEAFAAAWARGRALAPDEAVSLALAGHDAAPAAE